MFFVNAFSDLLRDGKGTEMAGAEMGENAAWMGAGRGEAMRGWSVGKCLGSGWG